MSYQIVHGNAVKWAWGQAWLRQYTGELFHAVLCDAPYHLTSITQRFGQPNSAPAKFGKDGSFGRLSRGFMNSLWDGGGVSFDPHTWEGFAEVLHPGGFIVSFGGSRTWHRIAMAMEEAGLIIHPFFFGYGYASGWPKATRIDTQIDRANGLERSDKLKGGHIGMGKNAGDSDNDNELGNLLPKVVGKGKLSGGTPVHPMAETWQGHRYGLQAIKPALEPIIVAQKPYSGRPVDDITRTGAGTWNIDASRIGTDDTRAPGYRITSKGIAGGVSASGQMNYSRDGSVAGSESGRWPSNLILVCSCDPLRPDQDGHEPNCAIARIGEQSGKRNGGSPKTGNEPSDLTKNTYGKRNRVASAGYDDTGTAARFFQQADWSYEVYEQLASADPLFYTAKPSQIEREAGLEKLPDSIKHRVNAGGLEHEPRFAPVPAKNIHPTVKPMSILIQLATLLSPPEAYAPRRLFVPFSGSGSEVCAAILSGCWEEIIGVEITQEYIPISERRAAKWSSWARWGRADVDKILKAIRKEEKTLPEEKQLSLFR